MSEMLEIVAKMFDSVTKFSHMPEIVAKCYKMLQNVRNNQKLTDLVFVNSWGLINLFLSKIKTKIKPSPSFKSMQFKYFHQF